MQYQVEKEKYNRLIKAIIAQYEPQNEDEQQTLEHLFETIFIQQHLHLNPTNTSDFRKMLHEELSDWTEKLESVDFEVLKMGTTHAIQEIINNLK